MARFSATIPHPPRQPDTWGDIASCTQKQVSGAQPDTTRHLPPPLTHTVEFLPSCTLKNPTRHSRESVGCQTRHLHRQPDTYPQVSGKPARLSGNPPDTLTKSGIASCTCFFVYAPTGCRVVSGKLPDTLNIVLDEKNRKVSGCRGGVACVFSDTRHGGSHV